eukprot:11456125-Ditylum_brightwellii.AAC.1
MEFDMDEEVEDEVEDEAKAEVNEGNHQCANCNQIQSDFLINHYDEESAYLITFSFHSIKEVKQWKSRTSDVLCSQNINKVNYYLRYQ